MYIAELLKKEMDAAVLIIDRLFDFYECNKYFLDHFDWVSVVQFICQTKGNWKVEVLGFLNFFIHF